MPQHLPPLHPPAAYALAWSLWQRQARERALLRRESSEEVYRHIWHAFADWACQRQLFPQQLNAGLLQDYLAEREQHHGLSPRHAWRVLRLLDRVLGLYHRDQGLPAPLACLQLLERRPDIRYANASRFDELPQELSMQQAAKLARWLARTGSASACAGLPTWQQVRNHAALALHLGAGLTPAEVRALPSARLFLSAAPSEVSTVHPVGTEPPTRVPIPLPRWAVPVLQRWQGLRAELAIPGAQFLPSTKGSGKPWGKVAHHVAVKTALAEAGLAAEDISAYSLRHAFALHALHRRVPPDQVARWLGVTEPDVMERYRRRLAALEEQAAWEQETS